MPTTQAPDAKILLATGCAHCPVVLDGLSQLLKRGKIGRLEAINVAEHPEAARHAGTRSVPWTQIGDFVLEGLLTPAELEQWVERATSGNGYADYYSHLLENQRAHQVTGLVEKRPETLAYLIDLLISEQTPLAVRIGVGVVIEDLEGSDPLRQALPELERLCHADKANIRADAAHFLGLTRAPAAEATLTPMLNDPHPDVREIAAESLEMLQAEEK